ncbi:MAG: tRNA (adenosine(37)-N6)-dimethylallyltransferase MiaA [Solirubrobacteraceae bacterium]
MPYSIVALFGPTAIGKTAVAIGLARRLRARGEDPVAVSADALQVYAGLEILTGAATPAERAALQHRLVGVVPVDRSFSVAEYARLAHAEIDRLLAAGRRPIVVGGTGLYLRAALADLDLRPPPAPGARERRQAELEVRGAPALYAELASVAPGRARAIDPHDRHRIVRALELLDAGEAGVRQGEAAGQAPSQLWTADTRHPTLLVGLIMQREALRCRIDARVDALLAAGATDEVRRADAAGASPTARRALGFEELLVGDTEGMRRRTRQLAKRQATWLRKLAGVQLIDVTGRDSDALAAEIEALIVGR